MKTATFTRSLGLGVTAVLVATAFPFTAASAKPLDTLEVVSKDGEFFQPSDYAAGDIAVQVTSGAAAIDVDDAQDLEYSWDYTPYGTGPTVTLPATGRDLQTTDTDGLFVVPLPVSQGPGTYKLNAQLEPDSKGSDAGPVAGTFTVGNSAPAGSTATVSGLAGGTPGEADSGQVTVTDATNAPIVGQVFTLKLDHGFFTDGTSATGDAEGTLAGNLEQDGTTLTGMTDVNGKLTFRSGDSSFNIGIARDGGFDDDGSVDASVTVGGVATSGTKAAWSSADPLNGGVAIRLSPAGEQENPVNPTVAGNRAFYDVFALDQFGNPVDGVPIDVRFTEQGDQCDDCDNSGDDTYDSDLNANGDVYVLSNKAGAIDITGTWIEAPTTTFDANGDRKGGVKDAVGTARATTYELNFNASSFSMTSSVSDTVRIGTTVTQTVRVRDQLGNPVQGYDVRFLRYAPEEVRGEVVATRSTNALGEATYTFIGTKAGRSTITAEVTDGLRRRELTGQVSFGRVVRAKLARTKGSSSGRGADRMTVTTRVAAPGARVYLYKIVKGKERFVGSRTLNRKGQAAFSIRDRNRSAKTRYVALVRSTTKTLADRSNPAVLR
jgi:hypothetical protein